MGKGKSRESVTTRSSPRCWKRRDLLKLPIPICALAAVGGAANIFAAAASPQDEKAKGEKRLCTYCGLYCGRCDIYAGILSDHAGELQRLMKFYGLDAKAFGENAESFANFEKVLDKVKKRLTSVPPCSEGCNLYPGCEIRPCAQGRGVETCAFCSEFPCAKISAFMEKFGTGEALRRQKEIGLQAWADEQAALVAAKGTFASKS
jgi:hypothetical protein